MVTRIIMDPPAAGPWNMAVDEACLEATAHGTASLAGTSSPSKFRSSSAILRLYRWQAATLSLGYFQPWQDRLPHEPSRDCPLVRRSSGGGAILHHHELTYSFVISATDHLRSNLQRELYDAFHQTLIAALQRQRIKAELATAESRDLAHRPFLCFQRRAAGDVTFEGFKIVGSAQRRRQGAILQHGSILLRKSSFAPELPGIEDIAGRSLDQQDLMHSWISGLARRLRWDVAEGQWTPSLKEHAAQIEKQRFASQAWTHRR